MDKKTKTIIVVVLSVVVVGGAFMALDAGNNSVWLINILKGYMARMPAVCWGKLTGGSGGISNQVAQEIAKEMAKEEAQQKGGRS